ncbi:MAG: Gfo/Idh/MocA family protein, partial [Candidatus Bathyarchaeia archaeon]
MKRLGVGFSGSGFIARFLASSWTGIRGADINTIYNIRESGAENLASYIHDLGMKRPCVYTELNEMLSDDSVDAVWILTPNFTRLETVRTIVKEVEQGRNDLVGVCCEKPLARTADEAEEMVRLIEGSGLLHGYLENQIFAPSVVRGKQALWEHGARGSGRPYLARAAEEHGGPHSSWFWDPRLSGGGVLLDMSCHSLEADRYLLTDPDKPKKSLRPISVQSMVASLKWMREPYLSQLSDRYSVDYDEAPAEDYALTSITYEDDEGNICISEARTSWCYNGPGLRISLEVLGPE